MGVFATLLGFGRVVITVWVCCSCPATFKHWPWVEHHTEVFGHVQFMTTIEESA